MQFFQVGFVILDSNIILLFMEAYGPLSKGIILTSKFTSKSNLFTINTNFVADPKSTNFILKDGFLQKLFQGWEI